MVKSMRYSPESVRDGRRNPRAESNGNICGKRIAWANYARVRVALFQVETNKSESAQNMAEPNKPNAQNFLIVENFAMGP